MAITLAKSEGLTDNSPTCHGNLSGFESRHLSQIINGRRKQRRSGIRSLTNLCVTYFNGSNVELRDLRGQS